MSKASIQVQIHHSLGRLVHLTVCEIPASDSESALIVPTILWHFPTVTGQLAEQALDALLPRADTLILELDDPMALNDRLFELLQACSVSTPYGLDLFCERVQTGVYEKLYGSGGNYV